MKNRKIGGWISLCLSLICLLCNIATAQGLRVVDLSVAPSEIWLHKNPNMITISAKCEFDGSIADADMWAQIIFPRGGGISTSPLGTGIYEYNIYASFPDTGPYTVRVYCEYGNHSTYKETTFTAHKLELSIDYDREIDTYMGGDLTLNIKFRYDGNLITPKKDTFSIYLGGERGWERLEQTEDPILVGNYQRVKVKLPLYSNKISKGLYDLKIEGKYSEEEILTLEKRKFVWVNNPLEIYMTESEVRHIIGDIPEKNLTAKVVFKAGDLWDLGIENVEIIISDENISKKAILNSIRCNRETEICSFSFDIPNLGPGLYNLELTVAYPSIASYRYKATASIPLRELLQLSGCIKDAKGKAIGTKIIVESIDRGEIEEVHTGATGNYSINLLPGNYNFVFRFDGGIVVKISNVSISSSDLISLPGDLIRYDLGHITSKVPQGMKLVKIMVLELAIPFSSVWVYIPYDSSRVGGDEKELKVYQCERWNFERSSCTGGWNTIEDVMIHTIKDAIEFNASSYGAFMIGENDKLHFSEFKVLDDDVCMGETVTVEGRVVNSRDEPVPGVMLKASFPGYDEFSATKTNTEGLFRISINAPHFEGNGELLVEAEKELFVGCNSTHMIHIGRKKALSILNLPDMVNVPLNDITEIEFTLFNSGQINLTETIYIHVSGISADWYELLPSHVDGLEINEEKPVILRIKITPELCGGACKKFYLVNLEAKSAEISRVASFTIKIPSLPINETGSAEVEKKEGGSMIPDITGFTISIPSVSSPYLPLTIIVILLILIVNKKKTAPTSRKTFGKQGKRGHELRSFIVSSLHRIKKNI